MPLQLGLARLAMRQATLLLLSRPPTPAASDAGEEGSDPMSVAVASVASDPPQLLALLKLAHAAGGHAGGGADKPRSALASLGPLLGRAPAQFTCLLRDDALADLRRGLSAAVNDEAMFGQSGFVT